MTLFRLHDALYNVINYIVTNWLYVKKLKKHLPKLFTFELLQGWVELVVRAGVEEELDGLGGDTVAVQVVRPLQHLLQVLLHQTIRTLYTLSWAMGMRQHWRNNVTKLLFYFMAVGLYSLWLLHWDTEAIIFFEFFLVSEASNAQIPIRIYNRSYPRAAVPLSDTLPKVEKGSNLKWQAASWYSQEGAIKC